MAGKVTPLVSVVIPAYNGARYIAEAVESVYKQSYDNWELIVIDDGSTDNTRAVLDPYMARIRYSYQENKGTPAARNAGVAEAKGELIAFLDNDDLWLPEKLELQVQAIQRWPECALVFTDGKIFSDRGIRRHSVISRRLDEWIRECRTADPLVIKGWLTREFYYLNHISSASSVLVSRECIESIGSFDETIDVADDYDLWLRIALRYPVLFLPSCLYLWRERDDSKSGPVPERMPRWTEASIKVIEKHLHAAPGEIRQAIRVHLSRMYWYCGRTYFDLDKFRASRRMLARCIRYDKAFFPAMVFLLACHLSPSVITRLRRMKHWVTGIWRPRSL